MKIIKKLITGSIANIINRTSRNNYFKVAQPKGILKPIYLICREAAYNINSEYPQRFTY